MHNAINKNSICITGCLLEIHWKSHNAWTNGGFTVSEILFKWTEGNQFLYTQCVLEYIPRMRNLSTGFHFIAKYIIVYNSSQILNCVLCCGIGDFIKSLPITIYQWNDILWHWECHRVYLFKFHIKELKKRLRGIK